MSIFNPTVESELSQGGFGSTGFRDESFDCGPDPIEPEQLEAELDAAFGAAGWDDQAIDEYEQYLAQHPEEMDRVLMAELHARFVETDRRLQIRLADDRRMHGDGKQVD